jgi:hypothetical protein
MPNPIRFENRFGILRNAGLVISSTEVDGELYELLALGLDVVQVPQELATIEGLLNVDKREGYAIWPILDSLGAYVWYHHPNRLVLCLARGIWG